MHDLLTPRWAYILGSLLLVNLTAMVGMVALTFNRDRLEKIVPYLVSLAAGALLGAAGADLLPESIEQWGTDRRLSCLLLAGFVGFFLIEKVMAVLYTQWPMFSAGHTHEPGLAHHHAQGINPALPGNLLIGGAIHSMIDGMAIAIAYTASTTAGIAATVAVLLHEIPHHLGDMGVLVYGGLSVGRALVLKFFAASASFAGVLVLLLPGTYAHTVAAYLLPVTAASFIYIALANLIPELHRETNFRRSVGQMLVFIGGILIVFALNFI